MFRLIIGDVSECGVTSNEKKTNSELSTTDTWHFTGLTYSIDTGSVCVKPSRSNTNKYQIVRQSVPGRQFTQQNCKVLYLWKRIQMCGCTFSWKRKTFLASADVCTLSAPLSFLHFMNIRKSTAAISISSLNITILLCIITSVFFSFLPPHKRGRQFGNLKMDLMTLVKEQK